MVLDIDTSRSTNIIDSSYILTNRQARSHTRTQTRTHTYTRTHTFTSLGSRYFCVTRRVQSCEGRIDVFLVCKVLAFTATQYLRPCRYPETNAAMKNSAVITSHVSFFFARPVFILRKYRLLLG